MAKNALGADFSNSKMVVNGIMSTVKSKGSSYYSMLMYNQLKGVIVGGISIIATTSMGYIWNGSNRRLNG